MAKAQFRNGDVKPAIDEIEKALQLYQKRQPYLKAEDQIKAYYRLGFYWKEINNYIEAKKASEMAIQAGEQLPGNHWTPFAYITLAYIYYSTGEYQKAIDSSERGMYDAKRANDPIAYLETWAEKIKALFALHQLNEGKQELMKAIATARKMPDAQDYLAFFLALNAKFAKANLNFDEALASYKEALYIDESIKDKRNIISNCIDIGYLFYELRRYPEALAYYNRALKIVADPYTKLRLLDNIGAVHWQRKQYTVALAYYQGGLNAVPLGFTKPRITALPNADLIRLASQKEYLLTLIEDKADTWLDYAKATNSRQRLQYALDTYKVADQMIDFMRWEHTGQQSKLYWREKTRGMYERAIETCFRLKNTDQAFRFFEKSRAVMLADKLNELGAQQLLSAQQVAEEQRLQQKVGNEQAKLASVKPADSLAYDMAQHALDNRQNDLDRFRKKLETSNPAYYRYKYDTTSTSLPDLHSYLSTRNASYVTYFVGDSTLYILGITANTTTLLRRPVRGYQQNVQAFMALLANPDTMNRSVNYDHFLALGQGLYMRLLAPLKLPGGSVIVSPDGPFVPFETLSQRVGKPDYLVNNYAFSYTYSARRLLKKNTARFVKNNQYEFLGVAPVDFLPSLKQVMLPGSGEALTLISGHFHSPKLLIHEAATRRAFLKEAANASIIHLFTHATADSNNQEPQLYFADSTLKLSDLGDGALPNVQLVVLAACKTGVGANQRGEGVFSLARGFAALGVPGVVTTLWSVQNEATYQLTDLFYNYLDDGLPKDIALQRAKQDWLKTAEGTNQLPNYWAGLIIIGDAEPLVRTTYGLWMTILPIVILAGIGGWLWRRQKRKLKQAISLPHSI